MWMGIEPTGEFQLTLPGVGTWLSNQTVSTSAWHYITVRDTAGTIDVHVDGSALTWASTTGNMGNTPGSFGIFNDNSVSGSRGQARLAELVFVDGPVNETERTNYLEGYAQSRFGL